MLKQFTKEYILNNKGCYNTEQVEKLSFINQETINIMDILNSEMPLKNKGWWVVRKTKLTVDQKKDLSYLLTVSVAPIFNAKYPNDNRVNECLAVIKDFREGKISKEQLLEKRYAYAAAADAAYAAYAAADAAYAYKKIVLQVLIDFVTNN